MEELPEAQEREELLDEFALLLKDRGAGDFLHGPLLLPTPQYFPDEWRPDADGALAMLGRLLAWARLAHYSVDLETWDSSEFSDPRFHDAVGQPLERRGAAALFLGAENGKLRFGLDLRNADNAERLVGVLAHEVAHAWRLHHDLVHSDSRLEERLVDLTTVFLGAGVFTTNNTFRYRSSGDYNYTRWSTERFGYLSSSAMSFSLAVALRVRDSKSETQDVLEALERSQKPLVIASLDWLPPPAALRARLGIPVAVPLPGPINLPAPERLGAPTEGPPTQYAWRIPHHRIGLSALLSFVAAIAPAFLLRSYWPFVVILPAAGFGFLWTYDTCSNAACRCPIRPAVERCTSCGAIFVGRWDGEGSKPEPRFVSVMAELDSELAQQQALEREEEERLAEEALSRDRSR